VQFGAAAVFCWAVSLVTETFPVSVPAESWYGLLYLAVFATTGALLMQNIGQKYTHPAAASILMSLESAFGVVFSMIFYGETLTLRLASGFLVIFFSVIISETKLGFLKKLHLPKKGVADAAEQLE
jgi:drug/metabolite transporter (DMT)-like permease